MDDVEKLALRGWQPVWCRFCDSRVDDLGVMLGKKDCYFRLNDGDVRHHTMQRLASLFSAAIGRRITYGELIA